MGIGVHHSAQELCRFQKFGSVRPSSVANGIRRIPTPTRKQQTKFSKLREFSVTRGLIKRWGFFSIFSMGIFQMNASRKYLKNTRQ